MTNFNFPYQKPKPNVCPGCGRCNTCGRGGYVQPYQPYYPQPWPTYPAPVWINTGTTTTTII